MRFICAGAIMLAVGSWPYIDDTSPKVLIAISKEFLNLAVFMILLPSFNHWFGVSTTAAATGPKNINLQMRQ